MIGWLDDESLGLVREERLREFACLQGRERGNKMASLDQEIRLKVDASEAEKVLERIGEIRAETSSPSRWVFSAILILLLVGAIFGAGVGMLIYQFFLR